MVLLIILHLLSKNFTKTCVFSGQDGHGEDGTMRSLSMLDLSRLRAVSSQRDTGEIQPADD